MQTDPPSDFSGKWSLKIWRQWKNMLRRNAKQKMAFDAFVSFPLRSSIQGASPTARRRHLTFRPTIYGKWSEMGLAHFKAWRSEKKGGGGGGEKTLVAKFWWRNYRLCTANSGIKVVVSYPNRSNWGHAEGRYILHDARLWFREKVGCVWYTRICLRV